MQMNRRKAATASEETSTNAPLKTTATRRMSYTTQLSEEEGRRRNMSEVQWTSKNGGISTTSRSGTVAINMTPHWQHMYGMQD